MTKNSPFSSVLIANRGEIACRVIRTVKAMGLRAIAVYSDADAGAPHVQMADDAVHIGAASVAESYLDGAKIIDAAKASCAGAIHPGYGFLSENAGFAKACADAGLVFIGPKPDAIDLMGDKAKAKRRMIEAGVPCVPGYQGEDQSDDTLVAEAKNIGLPIMVKAAAGGGGRGMRLVYDEKDLSAAIKTARSEAKNAFGAGELILERAIIEPRHVEIQVFADIYGNTIHLGERDCSVQRRHQKVLEESPCPVMDSKLREAMGSAAVKAAKDIGYVGAGTVEFLLDESGKFYFLEMNTRLQVEHPVTEMVTGLDLVAMQVRVAQGEPLDVTQDDIALTGHAIEARLYAEDPSADFLPATGPILHWVPATGGGIRIDAGIESGGDVSPYYDPMLAKIIAHGATREEARSKLIKALHETALFGVPNNKSFLIDALGKPSFAKGEATTAFIGEAFSADDLASPTLKETPAIAAAVLLFEAARNVSMASALCVPQTLANWASATDIITPYRFDGDDTQLTIGIEPAGPRCYLAHTDSSAISVSVRRRDDHTAQLIINGAAADIHYHCPETAPPLNRILFSVNGCDYDLTNLNAAFASASETAGAGSITAPMHGLLVELFVEKGDDVKKGDRLAILEAMKMQHELTADIDGEISEITAKAGEQIAAGTVLIEIANEETA